MEFLKLIIFFGTSECFKVNCCLCLRIQIQNSTSNCNLQCLDFVFEVCVFSSRLMNDEGDEINGDTHILQ